MNNVRFHRMWAILVSVVMVWTVASVCRADARTEYLINLLSSGGSYRVKVQAAQTLGRLQSQDAVPALQEALKDESEAVVVAAAAALADIGDGRAVPALQKLRQESTSAAVRDQAAASLRILGEAGGATGTGSTATSAVSARYLVKVDAMGNSSSTPRSDITTVMRRIVLESLEAKGGVRIQSDGLDAQKVKQTLKNENLKGFIVSGSLIKLQKEQNFIVVNITLNVFSNPDYNLVMMPSGEIRVPAGVAASTPEQEKGIEEKAIRRLVDNLVGKILEAAPDVL